MYGLLCKRYELLEQSFNMIYRYSQTDRSFTQKANEIPPPPQNKKNKPESK